MKKNKSAAIYGKEFENKIHTWLRNAKIPFKSDETISGSKRRQKDIKCDLEILLGSSIFIELKTVREEQPLSYNITMSGVSRHLKFHQICKMCYLIVEYRPNKPILITKEDLLRFIAFNKKNSLNYKDALKIGVEVEDMKWLQNLKD